MVVKFFYLLTAFKLHVFILLFRYCIDACLCSCGWQESFGMIVSVVVGFLYMLKERFSVSLSIAISRKLILLSIPFSMVHFIIGIKLLKLLNYSPILVEVLLYMTRISSTYRKYPAMWFFSKMSNMAVFSKYCKYISENIEGVLCFLMGNSSASEDAGELPRIKRTTFRTRPKFEIKNTEDVGAPIASYFSCT
jgi:hypothetical protein